MCSCLCVSFTYLNVCMHTPLYFVCPCCLFVQNLYMFVPMLVCTCVRLCVFEFTRSCECLWINCQTTGVLHQFQTILKIFLSKEKVFYQTLALGSLNPAVKPKSVCILGIPCQINQNLFQMLGHDPSETLMKLFQLKGIYYIRLP